MAQIPFLSRLPFRDYVALILSLTLLLFESLIRSLTLLLPSPVIAWFRRKSAKLWHSYAGKPTAKSFTRTLQACHSFIDMCAVFGYEAEEHILQTKDGYLLCLHRLCRKKGEAYSAIGSNLREKVKRKPVVYLHHGLLMNSEVWVCQLDEKLSLPFILVEEGYDVWFGNNRGNKYSKKSTKFTSSKPEFWNFSMDEFAFYDIPDSIDYVLHTTKAKSLSYIGFSQGTAQAFAALSIHPQLNEKVDLFIALAPAMSPKGLSNPIVDAFVKASPTILFLLFGRKALLTSTIMWQSIIYPPIFVRMIDISCSILFGWTAQNIPFQQKVVSYAHLYSYTSVKSVVHWFQIMRAQQFQMYDDEASGSIFGNTSAFYKVAKFPTRNIHSPIALIYGGIDSLVEYAPSDGEVNCSIDVMLAQLPRHTVAKKVDNYEHLDLLWGKDVDKVVFPHVLEYLKTYAEPVMGSKALEAQSMKNSASNPPAYSKDNNSPQGTSNLDSAKRQPGISYAEVVSDTSTSETTRHSERVEGVSYAQVAAEDTGHESDSDQTMGEDHDRVVSEISFADAAKAHLQDDSSGPSQNTAVHSGDDRAEEAAPAPGIDVPVTSDISYAEMAAK